MAMAVRMLLQGWLKSSGIHRAGRADTVELDTAAIVTAVADALVAVGALPPDSAVLSGYAPACRCASARIRTTSRRNRASHGSDLPDRAWPPSAPAETGSQPSGQPS
jgi:hypothetical protein